MKNFEELMIALDMSLDRINFLNTIGLKNSCGYFIVVDDGSCYLFDKDGNLDDISKIKTINEKYIRKDIEKIVIPDDVESIGYKAFHRCKSLTSIEIPNSIESIGYEAFAWCESLESIKISNSVKSIGNNAFIGCGSLKSIKIPDGVESIGESAFEWCDSLKSIEIPNSVKSIGCGAFAWCENLKSIVFHSKTIDQVRSMNYYPWDIEDESIIKCS